MINDLSLLVSGCNNYKDAVAPFIFFWQKYFSNELKKYWVNETEINVPGFECIAYNDNCFSNRLIFALEKIESEYILLMLDDYWILKDAPVLEILQVIKENNIICCNICNDFGRDVYESEISVLKKYKKNLRLFNYQTAIWNRETLLKCIAFNENPWQSELNGDIRLKKITDNVYNYPHHWYANGYLKGTLAHEGKEMIKLMNNGKRDI